jgi:hypothetical protein
MFDIGHTDASAFLPSGLLQQPGKYDFSALSVRDGSH